MNLCLFLIGFLIIILNLIHRHAKILQRDRAATFNDSTFYDYLKDEFAERLTNRLEVNCDYFSA